MSVSLLSLNGGEEQNELCCHNYNCVSAVVVARRGGPLFFTGMFLYKSSPDK